MTAPAPAGSQRGAGGALNIGRLAGVPIRVHWSVLVIMALIASGLSGQVFPGAYPGRPGWAYVVAGSTTALLFLLGLLAHEAAHAVLARRCGVPVESITLWLFGGVAQLRGEAPDPAAELRIAGAGPLVSLLLGAACAAVAAGLRATGSAGLVLGAVTWLAGINLLLAVFNLLPGAPLDGGRLLRAALWKWRGDRTWASVTAARAGQALGLVLVAVGLVEAFAYATLDGLWLAMIGWFIIGAARTEVQHTRLDAALARVRVRDVMTPSPDTVPADISVAELVDSYLFTRRHSCFPLVDGALRPVGLVTLRRVKNVPAGERATTSIREIACPAPEVAVAAPDEALTELLPRLTATADGRALVVEGGRLIGIVSPTDVSRAVERTTLRAGSGFVGGGPAAGG